MSGVEVLRKIKSESPDVHVIILSGNTDGPSMNEVIQVGGYSGIVGKPLHQADLNEISRKHHL